MSEADTNPESTDADADHDDIAALIDEIELIDPDDLIPYQNNPKEHPQWQIDKLASSIKSYGFDQPIVVDQANEIIKGHGRLQAARKLGLDEVPVIQRDDLSQAKAKASRIADNKTHMDTGWDIDSLALEFEELEDEGFDPEETGFDPEEVDSIIEQQDFDIDEFFEAEDEGEFVDDSTEGGSAEGPPPGEFECPECGHTFAPQIDDMGEREGADDGSDSPEIDAERGNVGEPIDTSR